MKQYIGTKLVKAEPAIMVNGKMVLVDDFDTPIPIPTGAEVKAGYKVCYPDGYESWSPRDVFERAYLLLDVSSNLKSDRPSICQEMVNSFIHHWYTETLNDTTTMVRAVLRNGFEIIETSSCVYPENYDARIGEEICLKNVRNKVWELLGSLLQTAVNGVAGP